MNCSGIKYIRELKVWKKKFNKIGKKRRARGGEKPITVAELDSNSNQKNKDNSYRKSFSIFLKRGSPSNLFFLFLHCNSRDLSATPEPTLVPLPLLFVSVSIFFFYVFPSLSNNNNQSSGSLRFLPRWG